MLRKLAALALTLLLMGGAAPALAQSVTGLSVKDGASANQTLCTYSFSATQAYCQTPLFYNGTAFVVSPADSSGRQIVNVNSLPSISGTVTANIGTSGSLALDASVTGLQVSQGSTTSGQKGALAQGAVTTAAPSYTTGQTSPLSLDTSGNLRINCATGCSGSSGVNVFRSETTTPLTGSATFTGTARDTGVAAGTAQAFAYFNAFFVTDQIGTAYVDCSNDNSAWYVCATSAVAVSTPLTLTVPVMFRYARARLVNGSTAETTLAVNTSYTAS